MELEDVKKLIAFDKEMMQKVTDVYEKKASVIKAIAKEKDEIADSTWQDVEKKVQERKAELDQKIAQDKVISEKEYARMAKAMEDKFNSKKAEWEQVLFDNSVK